MLKKLDGFWVFSTESNGYQKDQVDACINSVYGEYEKLFDENANLRTQNKELRRKIKNEKRNRCRDF